MSKTTAVVADPVVSSFVLSQVLAEQIDAAAEMAMDSAFDFRKACDTVGGVFKALKDDGLLNYQSWEVVRKRYEAAATLRAEANGAIDAKGAANDSWGDATKFLREYHGLTKPKSDDADAKRMAEKRDAEKAKALEVAKGKTAAELEAAKRELYSQATDEAIAQAKALEKVIKVVQSVEKDAVSAQMKPLTAAAGDAHKAIMEFMKAQNDPKLLGDYVVLLKDALGIWKDQVSPK